MEVLDLRGSLTFGDKTDVGVVNRSSRAPAHMQLLEDIPNVTFQGLPEDLEKAQGKAVRPRRFVSAELERRPSDLIQSKRGNQIPSVLRRETPRAEQLASVSKANRPGIPGGEDLFKFI